MKEQIESAFKYYAPTDVKIKKYQVLRDKAKEFALLIDQLAPNCREKSLAITKLEDVIMWANAGIARNENKEIK